MATKALPTCIRTLACTTYQEKKKNNIQENGGRGVRLDCSILYSQYQENNLDTRVNKEDTWVLQWGIAISFQILRHLIKIRGRFVLP